MSPQQPHPIANISEKFSAVITKWTGSTTAFVLACVVIVVWVITGPIFQYSDTWQLVINTATTVLTFLAVFLIQNTQNRNDLAVHLKLDELLRAVQTARTSLVDLEDSTDEEIEKLRREFKALHESAGIKP